MDSRPNFITRTRDPCLATAPITSFPLVVAKTYCSNLGEPVIGDQLSVPALSGRPVRWITTQPKKRRSQNQERRFVSFKDYLVRLVYRSSMLVNQLVPWLHLLKSPRHWPHLPNRLP